MSEYARDIAILESQIEHFQRMIDNPNDSKGNVLYTPREIDGFKAEKVRHERILRSVRLRGSD